MTQLLGAHREQDGLVLFGDCMVQSLGLLFHTEVDVDRLGVGVSAVDGITEVHEEGQASVAGGFGCKSPKDLLCGGGWQT